MNHAGLLGDSEGAGQEPISSPETDVRSPGSLSRKTSPGALRTIPAWIDPQDPRKEILQKPSEIPSLPVGPLRSFHPSGSSSLRASGDCAVWMHEGSLPGRYGRSRPRASSMGPSYSQSLPSSILPMTVTRIEISPWSSRARLLNVKRERSRSREGWGWRGRIRDPRESTAQGPRSFTRATAARSPLSSRSRVPKGRVREAHVASRRSKVSPSAVLLPWNGCPYQDAIISVRSPKRSARRRGITSEAPAEQDPAEEGLG